MVDDESSNEVSQENNILHGGDMAGRDVTKYVYYQSGTIINLIFNGINDFQNLIDTTQENTNQVLPETRISFPIQAIINYLKDQCERTQKGDTTMVNNNFYKKISEEAAMRMERQQFDKAHNLFAVSLDEATNERYDFLFKQYLITGFICYRQKNDMNGLRSLLSKPRNQLASKDPEINLITANIFQEICSRDIDLNDLSKYMTTLESFYNEAPRATKSLMANSLGLAYRRLGERTGVELLQRAILIFNEGLKFDNGNSVTEVDIKDQKAITYVRIFEFNRDRYYLDEAEKLLTECVDLFDRITDPLDSRLKPRVLNNLGNVYKQKALFLESGNKKNATNAIVYYEQAEEFWNESNAKYEWALLQKNKAEAKYALAKITRDSNLLIEALKNCSSSVKYRNLENSPYQWGKSVDVIFQIVVCLKELESLDLIPVSIKEDIILYTNEIDRDNSKWAAENFTNFRKNAKKTQTLLQ